MQPPFTLRPSPTRLEDVRTKRPALLDFSLFQTFALASRLRLQVKLESFNRFNTPWFGSPKTSVNAAPFGQVAPTQANDPRNIPIGVRLTF